MDINSFLHDKNILDLQVPKRSAIKECPSPRDAGVLDA